MSVYDDTKVPRGTEDRVKEYQAEIRRAVKIRKDLMEEWQENEESCYGDHFRDRDDRTKINKLGSFVESRTAALAHRNPRCKITPRNEAGWEPVTVPVIDPDTGPIMDQAIDPMTGLPTMQPRTKTVPRYKVLENVVNYLLGSHDFRAAANGRLCVKSALVTGLGAMKVGYSADYTYTDETAPPLPIEQAALTDINWLKANYEFSPTGEPQVDANQMLVPKGQIPISEQWFVEWCDSKRMLFDPAGENDPASMQWVAYEYWRKLRDVKNDKTLKNTEDLKASGHEAEDDEHYTYDEDDNDKSKMVLLRELWDFKRSRLVVLAAGHSKMLRDDPIPDGVCKKTGPWAFYRPVEKPSSWYGQAPATVLMKINRFYDEANRTAMEEMRKSPIKVLVDKRFVKDEGVLTQLRSDQKAVVPIDMVDVSEAVGLDRVVFPVKYPSMAPEMFQYTRYIAQNFDEIAGQPAESRGVASANTAAQVNALTSREFLREDYQRSIYAESWRTILKKLVDSLQTNMTIDQAVTILDGDGYAWMAMASPEMIQGDYDADIDVQDMEPLNKQMDRANLVNMLTIVGQAPLLAADEQAFEGICEMFGLGDKRIAKGISRMAQMQMMVLASAKTPQKPGSQAPENESDAIAQQGGGVMWGG
jgi:hypothetical protein